MVPRFGKYFVDKKVAIGGMAEIYRAYETPDKPVAIKKILPQYASEQRFVQMFLDEARIISRLRHSNIVQIVDFGKVEQTYFYAMEWIDGKPLSDILRAQYKQNRRMPVDVALLLILDVCEGLSHAHAATDQYDRPMGIIHRDISPPNIMVNRFAVAKVTDFGIAAARERSTKTRPGVIRGKFSYMSPEQSLGRKLDPRSDLFSVGIVFYEMLASKRLFLRKNDLDTIKAVRKCNVPRLSSMRDDVPEVVERLIDLALQPEASKRPPSASDLADHVAWTLSRHYPASDRATVAKYLSQIFPGGHFSMPSRETLRSERMAQSAERNVTLETWSPSFEAIARRYHWPVSVGLGLLALFGAEIIHRICAP